MFLKPIIITGGPGSGKSTLLQALANDDFNCLEEVSRQLIIEQQAVNGKLMPWLDLQAFAEECYKRMLPQHSTKNKRITFCDRGILDIAAYLQQKKQDICNKYLFAKELYSPTVFICPPWKEIYKNDPQRPQNFEESVSIYNSIVYIYKKEGFNLIEIPFDSVENRKKWIIENLNLIAKEELKSATIHS